MGSMELSMGTSFWNAVTATTREKYLSKTSIRSILAGNAKSGYKPVSPVLAKLYAMNGKKVLTKGGRSLVWTVIDDMPDGSVIDAYDTYTASRKPLHIQASLQWATVVVPMLVYGMDKILNSGFEQAVDKLAEEADMASVTVGKILAQHLYGDGSNYWDTLSSGTAAVAVFPESTLYPNAPTLNGFGIIGTSTGNNHILSATNVYAGINRSTAARFRLRANILDATSGTAANMGQAGAVAALNNLGLAHFKRLISACRRGLRNINLIACGQEVFDRIWTVAESKGILNLRDNDMVDFGIQNFQIDGVTIVADPDFCPPSQIVGFALGGEDGLQLFFEEGYEAAKMSDVQWMPKAGLNVMYSELQVVCQYAMQNMGLCGVIHSVPLT